MSAMSGRNDGGPAHSANPVPVARARDVQAVVRLALSAMPDRMAPARDAGCRPARECRAKRATNRARGVLTHHATATRLEPEAAT